LQLIAVESSGGTTEGRGWKGIEQTRGLRGCSGVLGKIVELTFVE